MIAWLTGTTIGKFMATFFISMAPVVELRLGLPYGMTTLGLDYPVALTAALLGNMVPVPFIIVYIARVFTWLRGRWGWLDRFIGKLEVRAHLKGETVKKYGPLGLLIFVAIPLPGTGAWTGALIAAFLNIKLSHSVLSIFLGVCIAAVIVSLATFGIINIL